MAKQFIRVIQGGKIISDRQFLFCGTRVLTGEIGRVKCFLCIMGGCPKDPRRGMKLTATHLGGPATVQVLNDAGRVTATYGIATPEQVAAHPRCTSVVKIFKAAR